MVTSPLTSVRGTRTQRSVDENSPPGTRVGKPDRTAVDPGDKLTYTLTGDGASSFDINQATGQITVGARTTLDTETDRHLHRHGYGHRPGG